MPRFMDFHEDLKLPAEAIEAVDTGWTSGRGAPVRGHAEAIVLAMAGRTIALPRLDGDGGRRPA